MKKTIIIAVIVVIALVAVFAFKAEKAVAPAPSATSTAPVTATVSVKAVVPNGSAAAVGAVKTKTVTWETASYPAGLGVNINLLRKVSDSPVSYELVRRIAENTANDGIEIWTPKANENGSDLYIEVTCASNGTSQSACQASNEPIKAN